MAVTVARVHLAMANSALLGLLPTPPKSAMMPSPAAACITILPAKTPSNKTMPGRADAVDRWDAHKTKPGSSSPSSSSSSSRSSPRSPASSSPGRASSCDRWDSNKNKCPSSTTSSASSHQRRESSSGGVASRAPSSERWDSNKRSSTLAERWDVQKKPRSLQQGAHGGGAMGSDSKETTDKLPKAIYAGPGFLTSPEPCMLPVPTFMVRAR